MNRERLHEFRKQPAQHFEVLPELAFINDFLVEARQAKNRIFMESMIVEFSGHAANLVQRTLLQKAKEGVPVKITYDGYTHIMADSKFNLIPSLDPQERERRNNVVTHDLSLRQELHEAGAVLLLKNHRTLFDKVQYIHGRNHMKIYVVDDVAWIGGMNFFEGNFKTKDFMVKLTDPYMVDMLAYVFEKVRKGGFKDDVSLDLDKETRLLIDSGQKNKSATLETACEMVDTAQTKVECTTEFYPDGTFLAALKRAHSRGVLVDVVVPSDDHPMLHIKNAGSTLQGLVTGTTVPLLKYPGEMHNKLLIVDRKQAITGSQNFSSLGPAMETQEIAMVSTNPTFVKNLGDYFDGVKQYAAAA